MCGSHDIIYRRSGQLAHSVTELRMITRNPRERAPRREMGDELGERLVAAFAPARRTAPTGGAKSPRRVARALDGRMYDATMRVTSALALASLALLAACGSPPQPPAAAPPAPSPPAPVASRSHPMPVVHRPPPRCPATFSSSARHPRVARRGRCRGVAEHRGRPPPRGLRWRQARRPVGDPRDGRARPHQRARRARQSAYVAARRRERVNRRAREASAKVTTLGWSGATPAKGLLGERSLRFARCAQGGEQRPRREIAPSSTRRWMARRRGRGTARQSPRVSSAPPSRRRRGPWRSSFGR